MQNRIQTIKLDIYLQILSDNKSRILIFLEIIVKVSVVFCTAVQQVKLYQFGSSTTC